MTKPYGCHDRKPYAPAYFATGGTTPIPHVFTTACQFTKTALGQVDPKCANCKHKEPTK